MVEVAFFRAGRHENRGSSEFEAQPAQSVDRRDCLAWLRDDPV